MSEKVRILVSVTCPYTRPLIVEALSKRTDTISFDVEADAGVDVLDTSSYNFCWGEYEHIDWEKGAVNNNNFCTRKGLIRKGNIAHNLHKYRVKHPESLLHTHVPETSFIDCDDPDYLDEALYDAPEVAYMKEGEEKFILKPSIANQAAGISIFSNLQELEDAIRKEPDLREWVIQRYIERPLLINQKKFHLRAYVLAVGDINVYLFQEVLVLLASQDYNSKEYNNYFAHLTNTCFQERNKNFEYDDCVKTLKELPELLGVPDVDKKIMHTMQSLLGDVFAAVCDEMDYSATEGSFELYGFDFMVDEDLVVYFLEANATPDLKMTGGRLKDIVRRLIEETTQLAIDPISQTPSQKSEESGASPTENYVKVFGRERRRRYN